MVNRVKTWIPPTIPLRNDLTAWKTICNDIHNNFILAGLVQTADVGQLDIDAVATLPADGTFEGYRMYRFNDPMQALYPVFIKLEFGCANEGLSTGNPAYQRTRTLRIATTVGSMTDGNGSFVGVKSYRYQAPQEVNFLAGSVATQLTSPGTSYFCYNEDKGFFGFVYGAGSRNRPVANATGTYIGSSLTIFIQRTLDVNGIPDNRGVSVLGTKMAATSANILTFTGATPVSVLTSTSNIRTDLTPLVGSTGSRAYGNEVNMQPIYTMTPYIQTWPSILHYFHSDIPQSTLLETNFNGPCTFKTIGREISVQLHENVAIGSAIAMLYEGDEVV